MKWGKAGAAAPAVQDAARIDRRKKEKGPLGGAGLGKGGNLVQVLFLISSFSLPFSLPYLFPSFGEFFSSAH
jgi:hypothetical protein